MKTNSGMNRKRTIKYIVAVITMCLVLASCNSNVSNKHENTVVNNESVKESVTSNATDQNLSSPGGNDQNTVVAPNEDPKGEPDEIVDQSHAEESADVKDVNNSSPGTDAPVTNSQPQNNDQQTEYKGSLEGEPDTDL